MAETLDKKVFTSTRELGEKSLEYMQKQYSKNNMSSHIGNIKLKSYKKGYKYGFIVSSGDDEVAVYNEFGTGVVGKNSNPLAKSAGYQYNIGIYKGIPPEGAKKEYGEKYCDEVTTPDTWWYHKNGKWWYTRGMVGKNMYSSLVEELRDSAKQYYKTSISQTIGNYNKKL